jgi:hypothetical protein
MKVISQNLTVQLAERVMGWSTGPDRYVLPNRSWMPRWQFQPTQNLEHAIRLLDAAKPESYSMGVRKQEVFSVKV